MPAPRSLRKSVVSIALGLALLASAVGPASAGESTTAEGTPVRDDGTARDVVVRFADAADGRPRFVSARLTDSAVDLIDDHPLVSSVEEVEVGAIAVDAVDPERSHQWEFTATAFDGSWDQATGDASIVIAVLDTGVAPDADLENRLLAGKSFVGGDPRVDSHGHGSAVALVAAAGLDNGIGGAGACPDCTVLPVQVARPDGSVRWDDAAHGILWAVDQGADVLNLSFGGTVGSSLLEDSIGYATSAGVVVVAAAGNSGNTTRFYPAAYDGVVSTGAHDQNRHRFSFSNHGSWVDLAAPGCVWVSVPTGRSQCGTSFASPIVAGAVGLLRSTGLSADDATESVMAATSEADWTANGILDGTLLATVLGGGTDDEESTELPADQPATDETPEQDNPAPRLRFADVAATAYYADAVTWLAANGISTGTTPTTFSPDQPLTRAQAATLLWRAAGRPPT